MSEISAYKHVMHEYEKDRKRARELSNTRMLEVYAKVPRIQRIDEELMLTSIKISRAILTAEGDPKEWVQRVREDSQALLREKTQLLLENGFPEDYLSDTFRCTLCQDTGYIESMRCRCFRQKLIDRYYDMSNLRDVLGGENFDTFDFRFYSEEVDKSTGVSPHSNIQTIYSTCQDFVNGFGGEFSNLLFFGDTGLGKTFLCNCIAKDLLDAGFTVVYVTAPRIFKKIEDFRFNRDEMDNPDDQIEMLLNVDLLIVDDLGSEFATVITNTELFTMINTRLLEKRSTIISTNLSLSEFQNAYSDRIVSRFFGNYKMLRFFGDDIRVQKKLPKYRKSR